MANKVKNKRKQSYLQICKKVSLNIGNRPRIKKISGRDHWSRVQAISGSRRHAIVDGTGPWVRNNPFFINHRTVRLPKIHRFRLIAKQQLRCIFGNLKTNQLKSIFRKSSFISIHKTHLRALLGSRLDYTLCECDFTQTVAESSVWIKNGWVFVNEKKIISSAYKRKPGDVIKIHPNIWTAVYKVRMKRVRIGVFTRPPLWRLVDYTILMIVYAHPPEVEEIVFSQSLDLAHVDLMFTKGKKAGRRAII